MAIPQVPQKMPLNLTFRFTSSCHPVLTKQLDVTPLKKQK